MANLTPIAPSGETGASSRIKINTAFNKVDVNETATTTNATDITTNASDIAANATNIGTNATDITSKQDDIGLGTSEQILATNTAADGTEWVDKPAAVAPSLSDVTAEGNSTVDKIICGTAIKNVSILPGVGASLSGISMTDGGIDATLLFDASTVPAKMISNLSLKRESYVAPTEDTDYIMKKYVDDGLDTKQDSIGVGTPGQQLVTNAAADGTEWADSSGANSVGKDTTGTTTQVDNLWTGTQAEYDLLTPVATVVYFIVG